MKLLRMLLSLGAVAIATAGLQVQAASAANTLTFRDCSFVGGLDPDFVQLSGAVEDSHGNLVVTPSQDHVTIKASESAEPGDSSGHDTLSVTVTAPGVPAKTVSGMGTGDVVLSAPLGGAAAGTAYTVSWSATFDNGFHACPSSMTPTNPTSTPFTLNVVGTAPTPTPPSITNLRQSHRVWRESKAPGSKHMHQPVGTTFSFNLNEDSSVKFSFTQMLSGREVNGHCVPQTKGDRKRPACHKARRRGTLSVAAHAGANTVPFNGKLSSSKRLKPGRYLLRITATDSVGQRSTRRSIRFTIA